MSNRTVFIEGIPGSGKSTLLKTLHAGLPGFRAYYEGDITPLELAWCAYMSPEQYAAAENTYPQLLQAIRSHTERQGAHFVTAYTRITSRDRSFYTYMEQFEIYSGRRPFTQFQEILLDRFHSLPDENALYECALLQNILEELMLFACCTDAQILSFYRQLFSFLDTDRIRVIRLIPQDIAQSIEAIRRERTDKQGKETWFPMMLHYLSSSPYGKVQHYCDFDSVVAHFRRRTALEGQILSLLPPDCRLELYSRAQPEIHALRWLNG